jgi:hypothetical protein
VERENQDGLIEPQSLRVKRKVTDDTNPSNTRCPTTAKQSRGNANADADERGEEGGGGDGRLVVHEKVTRHIGAAHTNPTKIQYKMDTPPHTDLHNENGTESCCRKAFREGGRRAVGGA